MSFEIYRVAFIGHRIIYESRFFEKTLDNLIRDLIKSKDYVEFYLGRNGDFDISAARQIRLVRRTCDYGNSSMILALPYHVRDAEHYEDYYDEVIIPVSSDTHYKAAITRRNEWLVDNTDLLIAYVKESSGGAYRTLQYAKRRGIKIINIAELEAAALDDD